MFQIILSVLLAFILFSCGGKIRGSGKIQFDNTLKIEINR